MSKTPFTPPVLDCAGRVLSLSRPQVMGIINATPDSFSDGGSLYRDHRLNQDAAVDLARQMIVQGATLLDIGGESTRPGAQFVSLQEEMDRVLPLLELLRGEVDVVLSVDTSSPELMREAAALGAGLINDVRALCRDGALDAARETGLPVCLMHMQGAPNTMQQSPHYDDVVEEVGSFLLQRVSACEAAGIDTRQLILDPGFGFGKQLGHNLRLLHDLDRLQQLGYPLLVGLSRKSIIGKLLDREVDQRLPASLGLAVLAVERGASIIRTHDVGPTVDALAMATAVREVVDYE